MSKLYVPAFAFALAATSTSIHAQAPVGQTTPGTIQPSQQPIQQGNLGTLPGDQSTGVADQRYEARRAADGAREQGPTVREALVMKLQKANQTEIELAKMASEKTDNDQVKQLTQTIIQDHQALQQKLSQLDKNASNQTRSGQGGAVTTSQPGAQTTRGNTQGQQNRQVQGTTQGNQAFAGNQQSMQQARVPQQLCDIAEKACENAREMTMEMLSKYEGQDFNMAFLGQQIMAHTAMLAELKAIQSVGPEDLQSIAQEAITKTEQHLDKAKQLAKKLEDDRKNQS